MVETWIQWRPIEGLARKYDIEEVVHNNTGFNVVLCDISKRNSKLEIHFEDWVEAYRCADETLRCRVIVDLDKQYGTKFYGDWTFFIVTNSLYIKWFSEQSCTISDGIELVHYSILAANTVLDIAAISKPRVRKI